MAQVASLFVLERGLLDDVPVEEVAGILANSVQSLKKHAPEVLQEIGESKHLTALARASLADALDSKKLAAA